ncbi:MAG: putative DNA-binding domain-containing protein [Pseudomonadaceae bacterium]|nr:putative DNA-binding domain-containing protein [Pseudomonadaceae bacterium]
MSADLQAAFAAHIRDPQAALPLPGIARERMAVYEELFFNTLDGFVVSGFPVLCRILGEARRQRLVRAFMLTHRCRTPYFLEIGAEFVAWLQAGGGVEEGDPAFVAELAHYERVELALDIADAELPSQGWSPLAWPLAYAWPVQRLCAEFQPGEPPAEPTCLLAWRDAQERVRFQQLSPFAYHLALRLQDGQASRQALLDLAEANGLHADAHYLAQGRALLEQWRRQDIWFDPSAG